MRQRVQSRDFLFSLDIFFILLIYFGRILEKRDIGDIIMPLTGSAATENKYNLGLCKFKKKEKDNIVKRKSASEKVEKRPQKKAETQYLKQV